MLDTISKFVTALKCDGGMTHLAPPQFRYEDAWTMGTRESMICLTVLGKCQWVYLGHLKNDREAANLNHHTLRGEIFGTVGAFKPVFDIVVLGDR